MVEPIDLSVFTHKHTKKKSETSRLINGTPCVQNSNEKKIGIETITAFIE